MSLSRRSVLGAAIAGASAAAIAAPGTALAADTKPTVKPPKLQAGDRVRVVAPGSTPDPVKMARGQQVLESFGLVVEIGKHVYDNYGGYLAGTDKDRLADLNDALRDPGVKGIFAARGGYGTQRIVDGIDAAAVKAHPKVVVGYSDITSLHGKLWRIDKQVTFNGPMVNWTDSRTGPVEIESLRKAVMTTDPIVLNRDPAQASAVISVPGKATGTLLGGNLTMIETSISAGDFPDLDGSIFIFEDVDEPPYSYDRMLTQLRRIGALKKVAGIVVGQLTNAAGDPGDRTAAEAIIDRIGDLGVPVLGGVLVGHDTGQLTVPIGAKASIDVTAGTLTIEAGVR
jgi:muramoyltetrapeptide carboxypeptidase